MMNVCIYRTVIDDHDALQCGFHETPASITYPRDHVQCARAYANTGKVPALCDHANLHMQPIIRRVNEAQSLCRKGRRMYAAYEQLHADYEARHKAMIKSIMHLMRYNTRSRRAFIDISQPLSSLFEIARQTDIDQMHDTIDQISSRQDAVTRLADKAYKHTLQLSQTVSRQFKQTTQMINSVHSEVLLTLGHQENLMKGNFEILFKYIKGLSQFQSLYRSIDIQVNDLLQATKNLVYGPLTPGLIPVPEVKLALRQIHEALAQHYPLYTTPIKTPQDFYQHTEFYVKLKDNDVFIAVFIPIALNNYRFQVYHIKQHPYPLAYKSQQMAQLTQHHKMIATSLDQQYYFYVDPQDLQLYCTRKDRYTCYYTPTLIHTSQMTCEHAIMVNQVSQILKVCDYVVITKPLTPNVYRFDHASYILTNVSEYQVSCANDYTTKQGCFYCLLQLKCDCSIVVGTKEIQPLFDSCRHANTSSAVTYPVNVMVAKYLRSNTSFSELLGHELLQKEDTTYLPKLRMYEHEYPKNLVGTQNSQLQLRKVMRNLKEDKVNFKTKVDHILHSHPIFKQSESTSFYQGISTKIIHATQFVWLGLITIAIVYLTCKLHILTAPALLPRSPVVQALPTSDPTNTNADTSNLDVLKILEENHHLLTTALICFVVLWALACLISICSIKDKWNKVQWYLCMCQHTHHNPKYRRVLVHFPSIPHVFLLLAEISNTHNPQPELRPRFLIRFTNYHSNTVLIL